MAVAIEIETPKLPAGLRNLARTFTEEATRAASEALIKLRNDMRAATPVGGTGLTRAAWQIVPPVALDREVRGRVVNATVSAIVLEEGARPHFPPVGREGEPALGQWIRRVLGITDPGEVRRTAFLIGRRMKSRTMGLPVRRLFTQQLVATKPELDQIMERMTARWADRIRRES